MNCPPGLWLRPDRCARSGGCEPAPKCLAECSVVFLSHGDGDPVAVLASLPPVHRLLAETPLCPSAPSLPGVRSLVSAPGSSRCLPRTARPPRWGGCRPTRPWCNPVYLQRPGARSSSAVRHSYCSRCLLVRRQSLTCFFVRDAASPVLQDTRGNCVQHSA